MDGKLENFNIIFRRWKIKKEVTEKLAKMKERKEKMKQSALRYDDVYFEGVEALDKL